MNTIFLDFLVALAGWLAFNVIMLSLYKDENENTFAIGPYAKEHWDNWLASFIMIPILLYFGYNKLGITVDGQNIGWDDSYYVASGFITEVIKVVWKKWKTKNQ